MNTTTINLGIGLARKPLPFDIISETLKMRKANRIHEELKRISKLTVVDN